MMEDRTQQPQSNTVSRAWVKALMLRDPGRMTSRLSALVSWLQNLGRGGRRRFARVAGATLAGASGIALMAMLSGPMGQPWAARPVAAAGEIAVNPVGGFGCTSLIDAINAVQRNTQIGLCNGIFTNDIILYDNTRVYVDGNFSDAFSGANSALPIITSTVNIKGGLDTGESTIGRDYREEDKFRIFTIAGAGDLTLDNIDVAGGWVENASGGGIFIQNSGKLTLTASFVSGGFARVSGTGNTAHGGGVFAEANTAITGNYVGLLNNDADGNGGSIYSKGSVTFNYFYVEDSDAYSGDGGGFFIGSGGSLDVSFGRFDGNEAYGDGGAISAKSIASVVISGTSFVSNSAGVVESRSQATPGYGGAIDLENVTSATITNSYFYDSNADTGGNVSSRNTGLTITNSWFNNSYANFGNGGSLFHNGGVLTISSSTFEDGEATNGKGGNLMVTANSGSSIVNSTIDDGVAKLDGGGIYTANSNLEMTHLTVSGNESYDAKGGGIFAKANLTINKSIVSGNSAVTADEVFVTGTFAGTQNVLGEYDSTNSGAFNFTPGTGNRTATSDGTHPTAVGYILDTALDDNGGLARVPSEYFGYVPTHDLVYGSPAVDIIKGTTCTPAVDQRGFPRPFPDSKGCDAGAFESYYYEVVDTEVFISTWAPGEVDDIDHTQLDILAWDDDGWTKWFDGMDVGLNPDAYKPGSRWKHNINAMSISDVDAGDVYMSFTQNDEPVPDIPGRVDGMDVVFYDGEAEEFELIFKGSLRNIGLNNKTQEKIDGLHVMDEAPEWSEFSGDDCEAYMLISTQGPGLVPKPGNIKPKNVLKFGGEDVLGFCATNLGANTTGFWELVLDGSAEKVLKNNIDSLSMNDDATVMYVMSKRSFRVDDAFGGHSMVFAFDMESEGFDGPYLRFMDDMGIQTNVDALHVSGELETDSR